MTVRTALFGAGLPFSARLAPAPRIRPCPAPASGHCKGRDCGHLAHFAAKDHLHHLDHLKGFATIQLSDANDIFDIKGIDFWNDAMHNLLILALFGSCAALAGQVALRLSAGPPWLHQHDLPSLMIATMMVSGQRRVVFLLGAFLLVCLVWPSVQTWWAGRNQRVDGRTGKPGTKQATPR